MFELPPLISKQLHVTFAANYPHFYEDNSITFLL